MSRDYEPQESQGGAPASGRGGNTVIIAIITSNLTSAGVFFALRELDTRGILGTHKTADPTGPAEVPSMIGLRPEQARELLKSRGLLLTIAGERADATQPAGAISAQAPLAGSQIPAGTSVQITLSRAIALVIIPNVVGLKAEDATRTLTGLDLKAAAPIPTVSDTVAVGAILGTQPAAGTQIPARTAVSLLVSSGPAGKSVPKVVGIKVSRGKKVLEDAGFKVGKTTYSYDRNFGEYIILKQAPAEGEKASEGAVVDLVVNEP